mmetsp:Transcript_12759/g.32735  ORF Transcript_12759/g.32735 Transcript_12759/m.32735 type:complete len:237 (+) Transcript_12759:198-908(+)
MRCRLPAVSAKRPTRMGDSSMSEPVLNTYCSEEQPQLPQVPLGRSTSWTKPLSAKRAFPAATSTTSAKNVHSLALRALRPLAGISTSSRPLLQGFHSPAPPPAGASHCVLASGCQSSAWVVLRAAHHASYFSTRPICCSHATAPRMEKQMLWSLSMPMRRGAEPAWMLFVFAQKYIEKLSPAGMSPSGKAVESRPLIFIRLSAPRSAKNLFMLSANSNSLRHSSWMIAFWSASNAW